MFRKLRRKLVRLAVVSGAGAAANYFFDRERGPERRTQAKEKAASLVGRQSTATDWQSTAANGFEPQVASTPTPPAAAAPTPSPAATPAPPSAPASAPVDVMDTPSASVMDILDGSGGASVVKPAPGTGPTPIP